MPIYREINIPTFLEFLEENLTKIPGTQFGSNEGGIHRDTKTGEKHYIKHYSDEDQGKAEVLAGKIYHHMGIHTLHPVQRQVHNKPSVATKWNDHLERMEPHEFEHLKPHQAHQIGKMYHAAILTKNWDTVGTDNDNILRHKKTGDLHAVDTGGAFHYRAQGKKKEYGPDVEEHRTLRHPENSAAHVFNHVFKHHPEAEHEGLKAVKNLDDKKIHQEFQNSGLHNWRELHSNFMARKSKLLSKYK